jgi:DNA-binding FadR family transcriptional regulator
VAAPLTDQAIAKIKQLIISGEFAPGSKLPREQDLAKQLGRLATPCVRPFAL